MIPSKLSSTMHVNGFTLFESFLRKEVIQPHLPIRLPCYDFTPLTSFTLGAFPSCELDQPLRVLPTWVV